MLANDLKRRTGWDISIVTDSAKLAGRVHVLITRADAEPATSAVRDFRQRTGPTQKEGYRLFVDRDSIVIEGHDAAGAFYGVQTLRQLLQPDLSVPALAILDWPEMEWRISYGNFGGRLATSRELIDEYLESCAMAKMNMVILETLWNHHGNWWFNPTDDRKTLGKYFFKRARELHIQPVPLVQGPGWGYGVTDLNPMLSEGIWVSEEPVVMHADKPVALAKTNVVTNEYAPLIVTSKDGMVHYQEGIDYKIIRGYTQRPYHAAHAPWRIQAFTGGGIQDGQTVLVSYNHVTPHGHKAYCLSDPGSYAIIDRTLDQVMTLYKPEVIHIGHDEVWDLGTDSRCRESGLDPAQLVLNHLLHVYARIKSHNPDTIILVWDDLFRQQRSGISNGILYDLVDQIPADLILCPWIYYNSETHLMEMEDRLLSQSSMGFDVIGTTSGYWMGNSLLWYQALQPYLESGIARGMIFSEWEAALNGSNMPAAAELMWSGRRTDQSVFRQLEAITARLKSRGIALTYPLDSPRQQNAIKALFERATQSGQSPREAVEAFRRQVIGDTDIFEQTYGQSNWQAMQYSPIHVQQVAMVQRIPALLESVADYLLAAQYQRKGDYPTAHTMLIAVINQLHDLGYHTHAATQELLDLANGRWLSATDLWGFELPGEP